MADCTCETFQHCEKCRPAPPLNPVQPPDPGCPVEHEAEEGESILKRRFREKRVAEWAKEIHEKKMRTAPAPQGEQREEECPRHLETTFHDEEGGRLVCLADGCTWEVPAPAPQEPDSPGPCEVCKAPATILQTRSVGRLVCVEHAEEWDVLAHIRKLEKEVERLEGELEMSNGCLNLIREDLEAQGTDMSHTPPMMYNDAIRATFVRKMEEARALVDSAGDRG